MNSAQIYGLLLVTAGSGKRARPAQIAEDLGYSLDLVHRTVRGERSNLRVRRRIAELLELPEAALWPDQAATEDDPADATAEGPADAAAAG